MKRTIQKKTVQAKINFNEFITKHSAEVDEDKLEVWMNLLKMQDTDNKGFYSLKKGHKYPEFINSLSEQLKFLYSLKKEAIGFDLHVYPPYTGNSKNVNFNIPNAKMNIVSRIVVTFGAAENFSIVVNQLGHTVESSIFLKRKESFGANLGVVSSLEMSFNTSLSAIKPAGPRGGRTSMLYKSPSKRTVLVFDFHLDNEVFSNEIISKVTQKQESKETDKLIEELNYDENVEAFLDELNLSEKINEEDVEDINY